MLRKCSKYIYEYSICDAHDEKKDVSFFFCRYPGFFQYTCPGCLSSSPYAVNDLVWGSMQGIKNMDGRNSRSIMPPTAKYPLLHPRLSIMPETMGEKSAPAMPLHPRAILVMSATFFLNQLLTMTVMNTNDSMPPAKPLKAFRIYIETIPDVMPRRAVAPAETNPASIIMGLSVFSVRSFDVAMPPMAMTILQMVTVMLTEPRRTENSSATGVKKSPAILVIRPMVAAAMPHTETIIMKYLKPDLFNCITRPLIRYYDTIWQSNPCK